MSQSGAINIWRNARWLLRPTLAERRLVGMVTQSDLVSALYRGKLAEPVLVEGRK